MKNNETVIIVIALLFALGIILSDQVLMLAALLAAVTWGSVRLWYQLSLRGVSVLTSFKHTHLFCGDQTELQLQVENRKLLPLPWLMMEQDFPLSGLILEKGLIEPDISQGRNLFKTVLSLGWYQRLTRRYTVTCNQRGLYQVGPVRITSGDPFGFYTRRQEIEAQAELIVYPRILPMRGIDFSLRHPFGDQGGKGWIFNDPTQQAGARDYHPGDPLSRLHWKATARTGTLQVRASLPSYTAAIVICLDITSFPPPWKGITPELLEYSIVAAASITAAANRSRWQTGLYVNAFSRKHGRFVRLPPSRSPQQLGLILTALASLAETPSVTAADLLKYMPSFPWGTQLVVISAFITDELAQRLLILSQQQPMVLIKLGETEIPSSIRKAGIPVFYAGKEGGWVEKEHLLLEPL